MNKQIYGKTPISFQDQVALLAGRGLTITDPAAAEACLREISYYRLSAYFLPYQRVKDTFNPGVSFSQILATYSFDRELRLLVFDCIERIEIAIRTQFIYAMASTYTSSHWQDDQTLFITPYYNKVGHLIDPYAAFQAIISKAKTARTPEVFIKHYVTKYSVPANPPSWMCMELLTMSELSHLYSGLRQNADKKRIADFFDLHHSVSTSWLHTLTSVRNICAHHSRLWNREFAIEPDKLLKPRGPWVSRPFENNKRTFYFLCLLRYLLQRANSTNSLTAKVKALFEQHPSVPIQYLGIPSDGKGNLLDWAAEPIWR